MEIKLYSTLPETEAGKAVLRRARQLTDYEWTPVRDVPTYFKNEATVLPAGVPIKGFPYASTEKINKFISENVSFETYISAITNPNSKIYQPGWAALDACNYGIVCNGLVRYAFGIKKRIPTAKWLTIEGMRLVAKRGEYSSEDIRLFDVLYAFGEGRNHVSLITDILKNEKGEIIKFEISEAIRPHCTRRLFTPEEIFEKFSLFHLTRYDLLEEVPLVDKEIDELIWNNQNPKETPKIAVDNGNKSNYLEGEVVTFSVNSDESDEVIIYKDGEVFEIVKVASKALFPRLLPKGYYKAELKAAKESVLFSVNMDSISFSVENGELFCKASSEDKASLFRYMDFRNERGSYTEAYDLTEEEKLSGEFTRKIPEDAVSFKVYYENDYGVWTRGYIYL